MKQQIVAEYKTGGIKDPEVQKYYLEASTDPFCESVRLAILELNNTGLLLGEEGKKNHDALLVGGDYTASATARCLIGLHRAGLLSGDDAQHYRDLLKKAALSGVGFMGDVVNALRTLEQAGIFSGKTT